LAVGVLASTTYNNFIADLLFLSEVSHSLLVAGAPCVHPYLGKSALWLMLILILPASGSGAQLLISPARVWLCVTFCIFFEEE
jgi:hypothetical protein